VDKPSLYAQYVLERTDDGIVETEHGFATFRFLNEGKTVYIVDIFVVPEARMKGAAAALADTIVGLAKEKGCTEVLGTVVPSARGSTASIRVLLGYGMTLQSSTNNLIVFSKGIK
jgi:GNAT superfamily N-acetyltransferase